MDDKRINAFLSMSLKEQREYLNALGQEWKPNAPESAQKAQVRADILLLAGILYDPSFEATPIPFEREEDAEKEEHANTVDTQEDNTADIDGGKKKSDFVKQAVLRKWRERIPQKTDSEKDDLIREALMDVLEDNVFKKYDASRYRLTTYLELCVRSRVIDLVRKEFGRAKVIQVGENPEEKRSLRPRKISLDTPREGEDGEEMNAHEQIGDSTVRLEDEAENRILVAKGFELIAAALRFASERPKKANIDQDVVAQTAQELKKNDLTVYRAMYTSHVVNIEHDGGDEPSFQHRRDIERQLTAGFLDYCLTQEGQRTLTQIRAVPIRECYLPVPLKDNVCGGYLGMDKGNYSKKKKEYETQIRFGLVQSGYIQAVASAKATEEEATEET